jgi:hypothetical protein
MNGKSPTANDKERKFGQGGIFLSVKLLKSQQAG